MSNERLRFILLLVPSLMLATIVAGSIHCPDEYRFEVTYRGTPPQKPRSFTIHEQWLPQRDIPFVTKEWEGLMSGWGEKIEGEESSIPATPSGEAVGEINRVRTFSLGKFYLFLPVLQSDFDRSAPGGSYYAFRGGGHREPRVESGTTYYDYHFLDVAASPTSWRVPLLWEEGSHDVRITIDFEPIAYVSFVGVDTHERWSQDGNRCGNERPSVLLSPHVGRTLRYEAFSLPSPSADRALPAASKAAEAFLVDGRTTWGLKNERATPAEWDALKSKSIDPDNFRVTHDLVARTLTVELVAPPAHDDMVARREAVLLIATPSTDGRWFGTDCVRFEAEDRDSYNPIVYTYFETLPGRGPRDLPWVDQGARCSKPDSPRFPLEPGVATEIHYGVATRQTSIEPEVGQPIPSPRGGTEAFLVPLDALKDLAERVDDGEWDALRKRAVQPAGVRLVHRPAEKAISLTLPAPRPTGLALVVGTRSSDHRFFGFDCVRLDPPPAEPAP